MSREELEALLEAHVQRQMLRKEIDACQDRISQLESEIKAKQRKLAEEIDQIRWLNKEIKTFKELT